MFSIIDTLPQSDIINLHCQLFPFYLAATFVTASRLLLFSIIISHPKHVNTFYVIKLDLLQ